MTKKDERKRVHIGDAMLDTIEDGTKQLFNRYHIITWKSGMVCLQWMKFVKEIGSEKKPTPYWPLQYGQAPLELALPYAEPLRKTCGTCGEPMRLHLFHWGVRHSCPNCELYSEFTESVQPDGAIA